jgi:hypothetical protein
MLLTKLAHRINTYTICKYISVSVFIGVGIAIALIFISKFVPIPFLIPVTTTIVGLSFIIGIIIGIKKRISLLDSAILADNKLNLKDRLGSAVEIINKDKISAMAELQLEDTAIHARLIDPKAIQRHTVPAITKSLPAVVIALFLVVMIPSRYGEPVEISQAIRQVGANIETSARDIDKSKLSDEVAKLVSKTTDVGRNLKNKNVTKKDALKNISDLTRQVEAIKMVNELSDNLKDVADKKHLNELLGKLLENLKDIPEMNELSQKIMNTQQANLSDESLKELIRALEDKKLTVNDANTLQKVSTQLADGKQEITKSITAFRSQSTSGQGEETTGIKNSGASNGAPGKESAKSSESEPSERNKGAGYNAELEGKLSLKGSTVTTENTQEPEKGTSVVPYEQLYVKYKDSADDTINRSSIPMVYRQQVKNYFDAIKPEK